MFPIHPGRNAMKKIYLEYAVIRSRLLTSLQYCHQCPLLGSDLAKIADQKSDVMVALEDIMEDVFRMLPDFKGADELAGAERFIEFVMLLRETCFECTGNMPKLRMLYGDQKDVLFAGGDRTGEIKNPSEREVLRKVIRLPEKVKGND
jgi:hypothetical protein